MQQPRARIYLTYTNFLAASCIGIWSIYLITMPLHPAAGDSHGGLLAAFSGFFLAPVALVAFAAGRMLQQRAKGAWLMQVFALILGAVLVLALIL